MFSDQIQKDNFASNLEHLIKCNPNFKWFHDCLWWDKSSTSLTTQVTAPPSPLEKVNCWQCKHFATSWDPKMPYSCKLLGFKSQALPCIQVMNTDGRPCLGFDPKNNLVKPKT